MALPRNRDFNGPLSTIPGVQYEGNQGGLSVDGASCGETLRRQSPRRTPTVAVNPGRPYPQPET